MIPGGLLRQGARVLDVEARCRRRELPFSGRHHEDRELCEPRNLLQRLRVAGARQSGARRGKAN